MRSDILWKWLAGVEAGVVQGVDISDEDGTEAVIVSVRPYAGQQNRCAHCGVPCPYYDPGDGIKRWRALDLGTVKCFLEGAAPRVKCKTHGVVVAWVPWARHKSRFTVPFEDQVAWLAAHADKTTVSELMDISWRTVGRIIERVVEERRTATDRYANLRRIGVDEISYRRGHRYLTIVVDHDTGNLLWAKPGRDEATLEEFFKELGDERCGALEFVSADAASWIRNVVQRKCPQAKLCLDPFHVVQWATEALDRVRRELWNDARRSGRKALASVFKRVRFALLKNPEKLTDKQQARLAEIKSTSAPVFRAYLLKEVLREVFQVRGEEGKALLDEFLAWASRSRLAPFVELGRRIRRHLQGIHDVLDHHVTNARVESVNTKLRLLHRMAFGFHSPEPLIALGLLRLGGLCPALPRKRGTN